MSAGDRIELYFYTHLESDFSRQRVMHLLEGKLVLTQPLLFNDPFDSKLNLRHDDIDESVKKELHEKSGSKLSYVQTPVRCRQEIQSRRENAFNDYRMFCLSENWDSLLMWAHYTRKHKGICLKLSIDPVVLPNKNDVLEPVRYTTHYPDIPGRDIEHKESAALRTLLLTKSVDWVYEKEWRYITSYFRCRRDALSEPDYVDVDLSFSVEEVYLGVNFMSLTLLNNALRALHGNVSSETIFELLETGTESKLDELRQSVAGSKSHTNAIDRERVLMKFRSKGIPLFVCEKRSGMFGLARNRFEYNAFSSLRTDCLKPNEASSKDER